MRLDSSARSLDKALSAVTSLESAELTPRRVDRPLTRNTPSSCSRNPRRVEEHVD
ncbi:MAG: hypothetical protein Ct9H300mP1_13940 [Planctomycetaceae bacterium]|nr:MAG: hypothetical protein Ct9H300mP1_13940 [Planctomycetaceae bacterium]